MSLPTLASLRKEKPPHGQAHLVFADTKANPEKPKELALPQPPPKLNDNIYTHLVSILKNFPILVD